MPKRKEPINATGQPVTADIKSWSLDMATDKIEGGPYVTGLPTESATIKGFWDADAEEFEICFVCWRPVYVLKERFATATTDTEPPEYIGVICRECVLKALDSAT